MTRLEVEFAECIDRERITRVTLALRPGLPSLTLYASDDRLYRAWQDFLKDTEQDLESDVTEDTKALFIGWLASPLTE